MRAVLTSNPEPDEPALITTMAVGTQLSLSDRREHIKQWQISACDGDETTASTATISALYDSLISFLKAVIECNRISEPGSKYHSLLEQNVAALFFWGRDFGVSQGELDTALQFSHRLRDTVLTLLVSLGDLLSFGKYVLIYHRCLIDRTSRTRQDYTCA